VAEWANKWSPFQYMLLLRVLRPDRVVPAVRAFVAGYDSLGPDFLDLPPPVMREVVELGKPDAPVIFILSPGVDPATTVAQLAEAAGQVPWPHGAPCTSPSCR
jgi:dynein heavy chain